MRHHFAAMGIVYANVVLSDIRSLHDPFVGLTVCSAKGFVDRSECSGQADVLWLIAACRGHGQSRGVAPRSDASRSDPQEAPAILHRLPWLPELDDEMPGDGP